MEFGIHQADEVRKLFEDSGDYDSFEIIKDYGGIERALYCRKKENE